MSKSEIGLIGLAVMGANLARNIAGKGFSTVVYNRTATVTREFIKNYGNDKLKSAADLKSFVAELTTPRKIILMVKAGDPVDEVLTLLTPLLSPDDIVIDCGNSFFKDTIRRQSALAEKKINFVGCGVSGGEEGALNGPSIMPGCSTDVWEQIKPVLEAIAAKDFDGKPCVTRIGDNGAGHYVKMVHNGIEYGVMQLIAETYFLMRNLYRLEAGDIAKVFEKLNSGRLNSYLFEIAAKVLSQKDEQKPDSFIIDNILDKAESKGTGRWTVESALEEGINLTVITDALFARYISAEKELRTRLSKQLNLKFSQPELSIAEFTKLLESGLMSAILTSYAQGYALIAKASKTYGWEIDLGELSRIWEGGCIIRAKILKQLHTAYSENNNNLHLFEIDTLRKELLAGIPSLRKIAATGVTAGIPIPCLLSSLTFIDSIASSELSANMIQGLRDYFGAHTFERKDKEGYFHANWN